MDEPVKTLISLFLLATTPQAPDQKNAPVPPVRQKIIIPPSKPKLESVNGDFFFYPGVVENKGGGWNGADNFLNLSKSIAVQINFIKAEGVDDTFNQEKYLGSVKAAFEKGGLTIGGEGRSGGPPLPFFNIVIMILPTLDGLSAVCQGRLFEEVQLLRMQLKEGVFQAITWEQTHLVYGPKEEFEKLLTEGIESLSATFVTRVKAHQSPSQR